MSVSLSTERWRQVDRLFVAALERTAEEQRAFLDQMCATDADLRLRVEALLAECAAQHDFATGGGLTPELQRDLAADLERTRVPPGTVIGSYRISHELGQGGMAVVYLAERIDGGFEQQVALKLIKRGLESEHLVLRFLNERQILASLTHPNIARLLDGGVTEDGRPFFAMEWVEGLPIDRYVRRAGLSVNARLRLFLEVGQAVSAAHRRLVVHRDLKPSNVLVTAEGVAKLLDFGIAKLLAPDSGGYTRTSHRMLTPEFASPEQIRGETVTTATDVYQLGVLLFLLLTGRNPHQTDNATLTEIEEAVCQRPPSRPSTVVTSQPATGPGRPARIRKQLRGDLDNIVLKALQKEPTERYRSVEQMVDDIERHLRGWPVEARRPSLVYLSRKWVWRHKLAVSAAVVVLALSAFYTTWLAAERSSAQQAAARAEQTATALERLFGDFDPYAARGGQVTVRELLDRAVTNVERDLAEQPEIQARLRILLAELYQRLGVYDVAHIVAEQALSQSEELFDDEHPAIGRAALATGSALTDLNRFSEARGLLQRALAIFEQAADLPVDDLTETLGRLSRIAWVFREHELALELSGRALHLQETAVGSEHPSVASFLYDRGEVLLIVGQPREAVPLVQRSVAIWRHVDGEHSAPVGRALSLLARALVRSGESEAASKAFEEALGILEAVLGRQHPATGDVMVELGALLGNLGRGERALELLREGVEVHRQVHGTDAPAVFRSVEQLGAQLILMKRYREARSIYAELLDRLEGMLGKESPHLYPTLSNLASTTAASGDPGTGLVLFQRALSLVGDASTQAELANSVRVTADYLHRVGDEDNAALFHQEADRIAQANKGLVAAGGGEEGRI